VNSRCLPRERGESGNPRPGVHTRGKDKEEKARLKTVFVGPGFRLNSRCLPRGESPEIRIPGVHEGKGRKEEKARLKTVFVGSGVPA
jgi:hypothetical protein